MSELYVVKRMDREVYKDKLNKNVTNKEQAHKTTYEKANNMLSGVKASERCLWSVYSVEDLKSPQVTERTLNTTLVSKETLDSIKEKMNDKDSFLELTNEICSAFASIDLIRQEANHEQSEADLALSDIYHFIEFTDNLNLAQTYKVMQLLKSVLRKRREAKNKIAIADLYSNCSTDKIANGRLQENVRGLFERQYHNRVLKDLSNIVTMKKEDFNDYLNSEFLTEG